MVKNRYSDILTYKHTRVELRPRTSCEPLKKTEIDEEFDADLDSYINANFIDVSFRHI